MKITQDKIINKIIITFLLILFIIVASFVVYYAKGFRFDLKSLKFIPTGAFFIKSKQADASIYIDGKYRGKTSGSFGEIIGNKGFIKNLLPKTYFIEIKKDGYIPWHKKLEIYPQAVTELKNILLTPETAVIEKVNNDFPIYGIVSEKKFLYFSNNIIKKLDLENNKVEEYPIDNIEIKVDRLLISTRDASRIIAFGFFKNQPVWLSIILEKNIAKINIINSMINIPLDKIQNLTWDQNDESKILFLFNKSLFSLDLNNDRLSEIIQNTSGYLQDKSLIYFINNANFSLYQFDLASQIIKRLALNALPATNDAFYKLFFAGKIILISEVTNGGFNRLFMFNNDSILQKITDEVNLFKISPDNKKLLINSIGKGTYIFYLQDVDSQPLKYRGEFFKINNKSLFLDMIWVDETNEHFIFSKNDNIEISEIDDRDYINSFVLFQTENPRFIGISKEWLYFYNANGIFKLKIF